MGDFFPGDDPFGGDYEHFHEELEQAAEAYKELQDEYPGCFEQGGDCSEEEKAQITAAKNLMAEKMQQFYNNFIKSLGIDVGSTFIEKVDLSKPLTPEDQASVGLSDDEKAAMKKFTDKNGAAMQTYVDKVYGGTAVFEAIIKEFGLKLDADGNITSDQPDGLKRLEAKIDDLSEEQKKKGKGGSAWKDLFKLLLFIALATAGYFLAWLVKKGLCDYAHTISGCYWYSPDGNSYDAVAYAGTTVPPYCDQYKTCCGDCESMNLFKEDDIYVHAQCQNPKCCQRAFDAQSAKHKGGTYSYKCVSPLGVLKNWWNDLKNFLSPANIEKILEIIGFVLAGILGVFIVFAIIRAMMKRSGGGGKKE